MASNLNEDLKQENKPDSNDYRSKNDESKHSCKSPLLQVSSYVLEQGDSVLSTCYEDENFFESRKLELQALLAKGTFKIVKRSKVPENERNFGSRWVDILKKTRMEL